MKFRTQLIHVDKTGVIGSRVVLLYLKVKKDLAHETNYGKIRHVTAW